MEKLEKKLDTLKLLKDCKNKIKNQIINKGDDDLILSLNECVINTLNGNVNLSQKDIKKLTKFKRSLRKLIRNKEIKKKKRILIQEGGFLPVILPSAITLISTLIELLRKK